MGKAGEQADCSQWFGERREHGSLDGSDGGDALVVGIGGIEAWADGVGKIVFGAKEDDACGLVRFVGRVGPWDSGGDSGGDIGSEQAFADGGIADEEGELAEGDSLGPEPADRLWGDVGELDDDGLGVGKLAVVGDGGWIVHGVVGGLGSGGCGYGQRGTGTFCLRPFGCCAQKEPVPWDAKEPIEGPGVVPGWALLSTRVFGGDAA